jgi:hypothetical protein
MKFVNRQREADATMQFQLIATITDHTFMKRKLVDIHFANFIPDGSCMWSFINLSVVRINCLRSMFKYLQTMAAERKM